MDKKLLYFYLIILLFISGCSCSECSNMPPYSVSNTSITNANFNIYANACSSASGQTNNNWPTNCTSGNGANYGSWVQAPISQLSGDSSLTVNIAGTIFFCSYGNDGTTKNITVIPDGNIHNVFTDNNNYQDQIPVFSNLTNAKQTYSQIITLNVNNAQNDPGIRIGTASNLPVCSPSSDPNSYTKFIKGQCAGTQGFGLSIYVGNKKVITLDGTNSSSGVNDGQYRLANLYNGFSMTALQNINCSNTQNNPNDLFTGVYCANEISPYPTSGIFPNGKYAFMVPDGDRGLLGFAIDAGGNSSNGNYSLTVTPTPPNNCQVVNASSAGSTYNRGAVEFYFGDTNPNSVDSAITEWQEAISGNFTQSNYNDELLNYLATNSSINLTITPSTSNILAQLVTTPPNLNSTNITSSNYNEQLSGNGLLWFKVIDDYYNDNVGSYNLAVTVTTKVSSVASQFLNDLMTPISESLNNASQIIFDNFYNSSAFQRIVRSTLYLYLVILGLFYTLGLTTIHQLDLFKRVIKIAIILIVVAPDSWDFFNDYFFSGFQQGTQFLIEATTGDASVNKTGIFSFVDNIFALFFAQATWIRLISLMTYLIGVVFMFIIIYVMIVYIFVIVHVFVAYLMSLIGVALLISLFPLFIIAILFERIKQLFFNWVKHLFDYSIQPVIMFVSIYLINIIFTQIWTNALNFDVCWGGGSSSYSWPLNFNLPFFIENQQISIPLGCIWFYFSSGATSVAEALEDIFELLIMVNVIKAFVGHVPQITSAITGAQIAGATFNASRTFVSNSIEMAKTTASVMGNAAVFLLAPGGKGGKGKGGKGMGGKGMGGKRMGVKGKGVKQIGTKGSTPSNKPSSSAAEVKTIKNDEDDDDR